MNEKSKKGIVYLLGDWEKEGIYKIGVTRGTIENRIKKLQTGNAGEIYICRYHCTEHPFFVERTLHMRFISKKVFNEWYKLTEEDVLNFPKTCQEIEDMVDVMSTNPFFPKNLK